MFDRVIRVAYFDPAPAALVARSLAPELAALAKDRAGRGYLRVHWARGPHIDAVIDLADRPDARARLDGMLAGVRDWVGRHPSTTALPADYARRSDRMADAEQWQGATGPFYADNSVFLAPNERRTLWGSPRLGEAAAAFHCGVVEDVGALAATRERSRAQFVLAAARCLASVGGMAADAAFAFWPASLSAHARLFLAAHPTLRPTFEDARARLGAETMRLVGEVLAAPGGPAGLDRWVGEGAALDAAISAIQADPTEPIAPVDVDNPLHIRDTLGSDEAVTARLTSMFDAERHAAVFTSPLHHRFRIVVNVMYEALAAATISPVERALACYLLADAIAEGFPEAAARARDAVAGLAATIDA